MPHSHGRILSRKLPLDMTPFTTSGIVNDRQTDSIAVPVVLDDELPSCGPGLDQERAVARLIRAALSATGYSTLREVVVVIQCQTLRLEGRVPTYYQKQLAQEIAQRYAETLRIVNAIDVVIRSNQLQSP